MTDHAEREARVLDMTRHFEALARQTESDPMREVYSQNAVDLRALLACLTSMRERESTVLASARERVEALPNAKRDGITYGGTVELDAAARAITEAT